jgi:hypothetical protein
MIVILSVQLEHRSISRHSYYRQLDSSCCVRTVIFTEYRDIRPLSDSINRTAKDVWQHTVMHHHLFTSISLKPNVHSINKEPLRKLSFYIIVLSHNQTPPSDSPAFLLRLAIPAKNPGRASRGFCIFSPFSSRNASRGGPEG